MTNKTKTVFTMTIAAVVLLTVGLLTVFAGTNTLGDYVWFDENGDGIQNEGPEWGDEGIDGVLINLYIDNGDASFNPGTGSGYDTLEKSMTTGDNPNTSETEHGWYDFTDLGDGLGWWVEIADSNFEHGGPLEGYEYTGENAPSEPNSGPEPRYVRFDTSPIDYNYADFPYTLKNIVSVGNLVWYDPDNDGKYEPADGEYGINGIHVYLFQDKNGNGIPEPGAGDGDYIAQTETAQVVIDGETHDGIYQFLDLTPSTPGSNSTYYFVAVSSADLDSNGYSSSSSGFSDSPLDNEDMDDGYPFINNTTQSQKGASPSATNSTYVTSKTFPLTKGGQPDSLANSDWGDAIGYADSSSYMTVDFGFTQDPTNAVSVQGINFYQQNRLIWPFALIAGVIIAATIALRQRLVSSRH